MRILHVIPSLWRGGAERVLMDLASEQSKKGHEVKIAVLRNDNQFLTFETDVEIVTTVSNLSYSLFGKDETNTELFNLLVKNFRPQIIHSHLTEAELITRHNPVKDIVYVSHFHGCPELLADSSLHAFLDRNTWWNWNTKRNLLKKYTVCNNHFLCISEHMKDWVIEHLKAAPHQCTVINNAVDTTTFRPRETQDNSSDFRLISIGKLNKNKNQQFLIKVLAKLKNEGIDCSLSLLGTGEEHDNLEQLANKLGVSDKVKFRGLVNNPETHINASDVLVHASKSEAFGLVLLEAMACRKPVVCFNDGGPAEIAVDGFNGFTVDRDDLKGFTQAVTKLATDKELYQQLSENALMFSQKYGLKQYAQKVLVLYEELLTERKKQS